MVTLFFRTIQRQEYRRSDLRKTVGCFAKIFEVANGSNTTLAIRTTSAQRGRITAINYDHCEHIHRVASIVNNNSGLLTIHIKVDKAMIPKRDTVQRRIRSTNENTEHRLPWRACEREARINTLPRHLRPPYLSVLRPLVGRTF